MSDFEYAKKDLVWPLEQYPNGRYRTHHDVGVEMADGSFCTEHMEAL